MGWITYTVALADSRLGARELRVIEEHLLEDRRAEVLSGVVSTVQGYCAARGMRGPAGSVPPECEGALGSLYRWQLISALPTETLITNARRADYEDALRFLRDVGAGRVGITPPDPTDADDMTGTRTPTICAGRRTRGQRHQLD